MSARLFRRIRSTVSRLNKTLVLTVVVLACFGFITGNAIAEGTSEPYNPYLTLFDFSGSGVKSASGGALIRDASADTVKGLSVDITLGFANASSDDDYTAKWNHVKDDEDFLGGVASDPFSNDTFVVRVCDTAAKTNCWLNTIPYSRHINQKELDAGEGDVVITQLNKGADESFTKNDWRNPIQLQNYPILAATKVSGQQNGTQYNYVRNISNGKNEGTVSSLSSGGVRLSLSSSVEVSLWYCAYPSGVAGEGDGSKAYDTIGSNGDTIATFGKLCGGGSYFRIGSPVTVQIPATSQEAQAQTNNEKTTSTGGSSDNLPSCGIIWGQNGTVNGCAAQLAYGLYTITKWAAALFGTLFDFFIGYSVSDASYRYSFAVTGWKLVRDISNVFFIIILVWTGFSAVFNTSKSSMKQVVPNLIVNALLINFSLFATRVVIDISNITARMFYSQMVVCDQANVDASGNCSPAQAKRTLGGYWPLSEKIVSSFNPQKMFNASILQQPVSNNVPNYTSASTQTSTIAIDNDSRDYANYFLVVCIVAAGIMVAIAIMFFKTTFLFLGRVVGLYVCMIFSPFAFLSRDIPMLGGIEKLRWKDWAGELTNYALLAPIFIFFLYIIYTILTSDFVKQIGIANNGGGFFEIAMEILIPMFIVYSFMQVAQKQAEKLSGEIGKKIQSFGTTVTGLALGAATGGAALVGSRVGGGLAKRIDESRVGVGIRNLAARGGLSGKIGMSLQRGLNATRSGSFDVRQTALGNQFSKQFGINLNQKPLNVLAGAGLGLGVDQRKGGYEADIKRRQEKKVANEKLLEEKAGERITAYNDKKRGEYNEKVNAIVDAAMANNQGKTREEVLQLASTQDEINAINAPTYLKTADELTNARRKEYAENLKKGTNTSKALERLAGTGTVGAIAAGTLGAVMAIPSMAAGLETRKEGDRRAAKKIEGQTKAQEELKKIENTLEKGFNDLLATQMFSKEYNNLNASEQSALEARKAAINADKKEKDQWSQRVQVMESSRYDMKDINDRIKGARSALRKNPTNQTVVKNYFDALDEKEKATKHQKIWSDISKYQEDQKKKAKGEESK